jgi:cell division protein FtsZ
MNLQFDIPKMKSSIIKVIGVGGGGSNAVNHMYELGIKGVDFVVCNTDAQALDKSPVPTKVQLGAGLTEGRGAGADPEVGKKAAQETMEEIKSLLANNTKMVFITAGMGGGTGTGAAPVIAKLAKDMGILTVAIVTSPFSFEGPKRKNKASEGLDNLKKSVDTILVINNERLREMYGNFPIGAAFAHADNILATAAKGIAEIITVTGYINVDFEDVKAVMLNSGVAIMGSAMAEGEDRAIKAVEGALHSPLLAENDIHGAAHILLNITSGTKEILMDEITIITNHIQEEAGIMADLNWGHCYDESLGEHIMVTLIATGFEGKAERKEEAKKVISLDEPVVLEPAPAPAPAASLNRPVLEPKPAVDKAFVQTNLWTPQDGAKSEPVLKTQPSPARSSVENIYDGEEEDYRPQPQPQPQHHHESEENKLQRIRGYSETIKTNKGLDDLEREPAYRRKKIKLKNVPHSSESNISRYTLTEDIEENISIKQKNPFLHDNID